MEKMARDFFMCIVFLVGCFAGGGCMLMGGFAGLYTLKLPLSVQVVDETTGNPIDGALLRMVWRCGLGGWDWGKCVEMKTQADGWATFAEVPNVLNNGSVVGSRPRKMLYLNRLYIWADGYNGRSVAGTRLYSLGLQGMTIPLRRKGDTDARTVPIDIWVVEDDGKTPVSDAEVWLGCRWTRQGMSWNDTFWDKTDATGHVRFQWTPPTHIDSADRAWKQPSKKFNMYAGTNERKGAQNNRILNNSVVLKLR